MISTIVTRTSGNAPEGMEYAVHTQFDHAAPPWAIATAYQANKAAVFCYRVYLGKDRPVEAGWRAGGFNFEARECGSRVPLSSPTLTLVETARTCCTVSFSLGGALATSTTPGWAIDMGMTDTNLTSQFTLTLVPFFEACLLLHCIFPPNLLPIGSATRSPSQIITITSYQITLRCATRIPHIPSRKGYWIPVPCREYNVHRPQLTSTRVNRRIQSGQLGLPSLISLETSSIHNIPYTGTREGKEGLHHNGAG